jgi:AraC-like DNA-binding protein
MIRQHRYRAKELADKLGLEPSYLSRLFRRYTGQRLSDYEARILGTH